MRRKARAGAELILVLGLLAAIGPLSIDTYLPSMPAIVTEFGSTAAFVQQTVSAYFVGIAFGQVFWGPLSDRFGRRPVLIAGLALYLVATFASVASVGVAGLIAARGAQGLGAAATSAPGRAIIRDLWAGNRAARAMSFVMMVTAFAPMVAPLIGGQIFLYAGWRAIFWLMFAFGAALMLLVILRLPETNDADRRADLSLGGYFRRYFTVLGSRRAWSYLLCGGLSYATLFAYLTGSPFVYIAIFHVDPQYFGFFFGLNAVGLAACNWLNGRYVMRFGYVRLLGVGAVASLIGCAAMLGCSLLGLGGLGAVVITLLVAVGPIGVMGADAIAGLLDLYPQTAGAASALFGVGQYGLGAVASVCAGLLYTGTPVAMALTMTVCALLAVLAWGWLRLTLRRGARPARA